MVYYDKNGNCTRCGLPGTGFVEDGVCECLNREEVPEDDDVPTEPPRSPDYELDRPDA